MPGQKPVIRIPFAWFHEEPDIARLRQEFPVYTVVRKEQALTEDAWARLALDRAAEAAELGKGGEDAYQQRRQELVDAMAAKHEGVDVPYPASGRRRLLRARLQRLPVFLERSPLCPRPRTAPLQEAGRAAFGRGGAGSHTKSG